MIGPACTEDPAIVANANIENADPEIIAALQIVFIALSNMALFDSEMTRAITQPLSRRLVVRYGPLDGNVAVRLA
jgi:hypothetical protein